MALDLRLHRAKFRGAEFLADSMRTESGRKTVTHEYPNKDFRFVEDLGKNLPIFTITGTIAEPLYIIKKKRLQDALDAPGPGLLVHPFYGTKKVVSTTYTISEDMTALGEATFTMTFQVANNNIFPVDSKDNLSKIANLADEVSDNVDEYLENNFIINNAENISDAAEKLGELVGALTDIITPIDVVTDDLNQFNGQKLSFQDNIFSLIQNPTQLAAALTTLLGSFNSLAPTGAQQVNINSKLFGFGSSDITLEQNTTIKIERKKNRDVINNSVNSISLANSYQGSSLVEYQNDEELNNMQDSLNENYESLINQDNAGKEVELSQEQLRNETQLFYDDTRVNVNKIITVETSPIPIAVLTYSYYGSLDDEEQIISLNNITDPSIVKWRDKNII